MRKAILMLLLAVVSGSATAEWVELGGNEHTTLYVDPSSIRRAGDFVEMWNLHDFKKVRAMEHLSYWSFKGQGEYDCKQARMRLLSASRHAEKMGTGQIIASESSASGWESAAPGGAGDVLWKFACGK